MDRAVVIYDDDCGFCRWTADRLLRWDRAGRLRALALRTEDADRLLAALSPAERGDSWHLVTPDGRVRSGGDAVEPLLRLLPGGKPGAWLAASFPGATDRAYRAVARNRSTLGRLLGARRCDVDPGAASQGDRP